MQARTSLPVHASGETPQARRSRRLAAKVECASNQVLDAVSLGFSHLLNADARLPDAEIRDGYWGKLINAKLLRTASLPLAQ
jgi:hypothetical protein